MKQSKFPEEKTRTPEMQGGFGAAAAKAAEGPAPGMEAAADIGRISEQTVAEGQIGRAHV